jgi:hypothetical protein
VTALHSATTAVNVGSAIAPSAGQILTATSSTAATWQSVASTFSIGTDINPLHWWRADNTVQTGGLVDTIVDNGTSPKNFTQTLTPRCPTAVDGNGKAYLAPDGANDFYQAGAVADWKFLNDGSPWTICMVYQRNALVVAVESLVDTTDNTTTSTGMFLVHGFVSSVKQGPECAITSSTASAFVQVTNSFVPNTNLEILIIRHTGTNSSVPTIAAGGTSSFAVDMMMRRQGAQVSQSTNSVTNPPYNATSSVTYANTNPSFVLTLFRRASTAASFSAARLYELLIHNTALTDGQIQGYESYAHLIYGTPGSNAVVVSHTATSLATTGASVQVNTAIPPSTGQALIATSPTAATWQSVASTFSIGTDINPLHWWRADNTVQTGGLVDTIVDNGTSPKNFTQSGAPRCPIAVDGSGKTYLALDGSVDFYQAGAVADWKFLNDGSPFTIAIVFHRTTAISGIETLFDTADVSTNFNGISTFLNYTSAAIQGPQCSISKGIAPIAVQVTNTFLPNTSLRVLVIRHRGQSVVNSALTTPSVPTDMDMRSNGALVSSSSSAVGYNSANPDYTLTLGRSANSSTRFTSARIYEVLIHNTALSDSQIQGYESYAHLIYGTPGSNAVVVSTSATALATTGANVQIYTALPPSSGQALIATSPTAATWQALSGYIAFSVANNIAPAHWWRADNTIQTTGLVDTIVDNGTLPVHFTQSGAARCPTAVDGLGNTYLAPDGAVDFYTAGSVSDWKFLNDGSPWTFAIVYNRNAATAAQETFLDTCDGSTGSTGFSSFILFTSATVQGPVVLITNSTAGQAPLTVESLVLSTNLSVLIVRFTGDNSATPVGSITPNPVDVIMRRMGVLASFCNKKNAFNNANPSFNMTLFRRAGTADRFTTARTYEFILDNKAWNDNQVQGFEEYARARYGVAISPPVVASSNALTRGRTPLWYPPATAGTADEEFDSTTLNPAFIFRDTTTGPTNRTPTTTTIVAHTALASSTTPPVYNLHTNGRRSFLLIQTPAASTPTYAVVKPFTFTPGNFYYSSFGCLVSGPATAGANIRLALLADLAGNPDLNNYVFMNLRDVSGVANINCGTVIGGSLTNNNVLALNAGQPYPDVVIQNWGSIASPKWDLGVMSDSGVYQLIGNNLTPGSMGTPAWIGWIMQNSGATVPNVFAIDYLRESTTLPLLSAQTVFGAGPAGATGQPGTVAFNAANSFTWSSNAATLNTAGGGDFTATNTLTGNSTLTLTNGVDGAQGLVYVKQDATGGRTITFTITGRTILRDANSVDDNPESTANSLTVYSYHYVTVAGTACTRITRVFL